jgi:hypothetical protein
MAQLKRLGVELDVEESARTGLERHAGRSDPELLFNPRAHG